MIIDDLSFHDSTILAVTESTNSQTIDFLVDFPTNSDDNIFEKRIFRFHNVTYYCINEIPFEGHPTILNIVNLGQSIKTFGFDSNLLAATRTKIEMQTNSGSRLIEFSDCELLTVTE
jgi:hypothetical protein